MWDDAKALNALAATLAAMALVALAGVLVHKAARLPAFAIREVVVTTPLARVSAPHLEAAIRDELGGTFFSMDLDRARAAVAKVPWVRSVSLRRQWPHRLEIAVEEHEPLARWREGRLVSARGETFAAAHDAPLPRFDGPEGYAGEIAVRYAEWRPALASLGLELAGIDVSPRGGWRVRAQRDGRPLVLELGHDDPAARLARFAHAYPRTVAALHRQGVAIEHVDLRYRNGFAARVPGFREAGAKPAQPRGAQ